MDGRIYGDASLNQFYVDRFRDERDLCVQEIKVLNCKLAEAEIVIKYLCSITGNNERTGFDILSKDDEYKIEYLKNVFNKISYVELRDALDKIIDKQ